MKFMPWLWLIVGGLFEVGFTTSLRFVDGFRNAPWTIAFLVSVAISMALLEIASRSIPMGTAYAVWGGIGAVGTVIVGILWFHEPASTVRMLLILAIVVAIAALKLPPDSAPLCSRANGFLSPRHSRYLKPGRALLSREGESSDALSRSFMVPWSDC